mmetsp:Transcript_28005/g.89371  ORF Transcript_28005/g.89371 Transcript_28005/m.89371 type:complete len:208 (-) Transcript_28005:274-897(-)
MTWVTGPLTHSLVLIPPCTPLDPVEVLSLCRHEVLAPRKHEHSQDEPGHPWGDARPEDPHSTLLVHGPNGASDVLVPILLRRLPNVRLQPRLDRVGGLRGGGRAHARRDAAHHVRRALVLLESLSARKRPVEYGAQPQVPHRVDRFPRHVRNQPPREDPDAVLPHEEGCLLHELGLILLLLNHHKLRRPRHEARCRPRDGGGNNLLN